MVSVLDLMTLCLDLANFGSAEANPADSSIYVLSKISLFWDVGFCIQNCCQTPREYFPPIPDPISPISDQNLPDFGGRGVGGTAENSL